MTVTSDARALSDEQRAAVKSNATAIIVVASAGSGKTEVVARRVERLLSEAPESAFRVLAITYTVKAADELSERFRLRLGALDRRVETNTVHGFAHSLLRSHGTRLGLPVEPEVLTQDEDRAELLTRWLNEEQRPLSESPDTIFRELDLARAKQDYSPLLEDWEAALVSAGAVDYPSMLAQATELLKLSSVRRQMDRLYGHVIVDEAQNLTPAQYAFLVELIGPPASDAGRHLPTMLVGDDKQSIVRFAGADPQLIGRFANEYRAERYELRVNFRSARRIAHVGSVVAQRLGSNGTPRPEAANFAAPGSVQFSVARDEEEEGREIASWVSSLIQDGVPASASAPGESRAVRAEEIAVLGRSAAALNETKRALELAGHTPAMSSTPDDWLSTTAGRLAFEAVALRSASDHRSTHWHLARLLGVDEQAVSSIQKLGRVLQEHPDRSLRALSAVALIDEPSNFIRSLATLDMPDTNGGVLAANWDADCRQLTDAWRAFEQRTETHQRTWGNFRLHVSRTQRGDDLAPGVRLLTVHRAQGREYRAVAIVALNDGQFPDFRASDADSRISELRTFYVAVSRPTRVLFLSRSSVRRTRYGRRATTPSPYLELVREALDS